MREGITNGISLSRNEIIREDNDIYFNFNEDYFKFINVSADGDCLYHSNLKCHTLSEKLMVYRN